MSTKKLSLLILSAVVVLLCLFAIPALADNGNGLDKVPDPIDPQSWQKQEDMLWEDLKPNPVIDWMTELNTEGLVNPKASGSKDPIRGALLLVDYWDRPFITTQPINTDLLGYYLYDQFGQYEKTITKNPLIQVDLADYTQWIADFLNVPQEFSHGLTIDGYWRENSYGKWQVELDSYGPYTLQGFEFEFSPSYNTYADFPPTFRRGASGTSGSRSLVNESIALAWQNDVYLGDYDFFFILHAGYNESAVWYEFGMMQWATPEEVPYEYGPGAKMEHVEEVLTEHPEYLLSLETTTRSFSDSTPVINGYNQNTVLKDAIAEVKARQEAGTLDQFQFKFPQADWDWYENYTWGNAAPTRYVPWTSWIAAMSSWASAGSASVPVSPENGGGSRSVQYSQQSECDGMGTFAHEFGHIVSHTDNYESTMWTQNVSPKTDYWDLMARGDRNGPGGYHARWSVPGGKEASASPGHMMMFPKKRSGYYDQGDLLSLSVAGLKTSTPVVANVVSRNIPLNNGGYYPWLEEYGLVNPNFYKGIDIEFDSQNPDQAVLQTTGWSWTRFRAGRMGVEVVDQTGYDSFSNDHGVLLSRLETGSNAQNRAVIDSHLYDIKLVDYYLNDEPVYYVIGHADQLDDALFHAGISSVDTGYYEGSMRQWEERNDRPIVSGDTVNEFHDPYNKLHVYILDKKMNPAKYGEFLSYEIGVLHEDGVAVGGELVVETGELIAAVPGMVAQQDFTITNTGEATDIVRVSVSDIDFPVTLLNNLYAIGAGETITVPVYVEIPFETDVDNMQGQSLIFTASSESNAMKSSTVAISTLDLIVGGKTNLRLVTDANLVKSGDYFRANAYFREAVDGNTATVEFVFDTTKFSYRNFTPAEGVEILNTAVTDTGVKFTFMKRDYAMKTFGELLLSAKEDIDMTKDVNEIKVAVDYVTRVDGEKVVKGEVASTCFTTYPIDPIEGEYSLVALSNLIDVFGMRNTHKDWNDYRFYDFNKNNMIDIQDISKLASMIQE